MRSHGRGRGFESLIAHRKKPLLSGGFFAFGASLGVTWLQRTAAVTSAIAVKSEHSEPSVERVERRWLHWPCSLRWRYALDFDWPR